MPFIRALSLLLAAALLCPGCSQAWYNAFLDPSQAGNFRTNEIVEIQKSISFHDKPLGVPGASEPKPEDLVAVVEEYRIGPGDTLSIRLLDFLQVNTETDLTPIQVNELGVLEIPQIGTVQAEGRTASELQQDLIARAKQKQIYREDDQPTVTVTVLAAQGRTFNVSGTIQAPGPYQIIRPDFRLMDALNVAGGLDAGVKNIYVFRNQPREKVVRDGKTSAPPAGPEPAQPEDIPPAPPVSPMTLMEMGPATTPATANQNASDQPTTRLAVPREAAEEELRDAIEPGPATGPAAPQGAPAESRPKWRFLNDHFIESPGPEPTTSAPVAPRAHQVTPPPPPTTEPVDWEELAQEGQQRIIRIPAEKLRNGDASYNVVIQHNDWIRVDPGPVGVFYLHGHVVRQGTYGFTGEEITLRQAIATASGLDPLAWPTRCSITRRLDENREEILQIDLARIMEGKDPDFYLKPNDLVDVGTHAIAPLLATIRNSFRLTYGFGFVYDRNFADIDAYFPQSQPREVGRATLQSRFPGLFP